jgi:glutaredoxin
MGPHVKDVINEQEAEKLFTEQGFRKVPQLVQAGSHHYGMILTK